MQLLLAADDATRPLYVFTAFGAGVLSFLSPCVLPIVPAYLSLITGVSVGEMQEGDVKVLPRIAYDTALFVAGFTVVFVLLGLITTAAGEALFENQETLTRISGALVILMFELSDGSMPKDVEVEYDLDSGLWTHSVYWKRPELLTVLRDTMPAS